MGDENTKAVREKARRSRTEREKEVRKKYDFSVIRTLRQERGLTIEKFAKLCGLSYAPISRIETNLIKPNLETLDKIAAGLGITTYNLVAMAEKRDAHKVEPKCYESGGFELTTYTFGALDVTRGSAAAGAETTSLDVRQREFESIIVESGVLEIAVGETTFRLGAGESLQYDRIFARSYTAIEDCELVIVSHSTTG